MSHEYTEPGRVFTYRMFQQPSDVLRRMQFDSFFQSYHGSSFSVRTLDGWSWSSSSHQQPRFIATFQSSQLLDMLIRHATETTLGRMFLDGKLDIQGEMHALLSVAQYALHHSEGLSGNLVGAISRFCIEIPKRFKPASRHVGPANWRWCPCPLDLPVRFFESWLGSSLYHSCTAVPGSREDFLTAQGAAIEAVCQALEIEPGDHLLDMSCGWGALLLYAAKHCGAEVQGITSSDVQAEIAAERILASGLQSHAIVGSRDLRTVPLRDGCFDKIADISLFEQVRCCDFAEYLGSVQHMLAHRGLLLLHRITRSRQTSGAALRSLEPDLSFEPLAHEMETAESAGFKIVKVESLQREYEFTLRLWIDRLRRNLASRNSGMQDDVASERGQRAWLLYLIETATYLESGDLQVHRLVLRRQVPACKAL